MSQSMKYGNVETKKGSISRKEPVFLLRAQDQLAEKYLRLYAEDVLAHTGDVGFYRMVLNEANNFANWQTKKLPD